MSHIANPTRTDLDLSLIYDALENQLADMESDHIINSDDEYERGLKMVNIEEQMELICTIQDQEETGYAR